jgi:hypothetical protein
MNTAQKLPTLTSDHADVDEWRELHAVALDAQAETCDRWLLVTKVLIEQRERHDDEALLSELRRTAALVRDRRNELERVARALRTPDA